eukprot:CAMPEP_0171313678 /NCGR_PEP_ID=MMETSP0816-20121228/44844_1 /TAXON_ID=420281 /ORGANISM="Proboscia inermis, Strain CCAP1064/1" /LENGTH=69 /DNA_ID=CAMNT_0011801451 /DNA_START=449 /DNA_END=658 /DNA_ORIENTATION=-
MAIHKLALLVSFYDVSIANIESVTAGKEFSSMQTLKGSYGKEFTDLDKISTRVKPWAVPRPSTPIKQGR